MDSEIEPALFTPLSDTESNLGAISPWHNDTTERMRELWVKCREVQDALGEIKIRDVVTALDINEMQAAELQGCIYTLLMTGPKSHCFAPERMVIRLAKERWPGMPCWDEIPGIWLTEAAHECVELVRRGGSLVKAVQDLKLLSDGEQATAEKVARPVSANQLLAYKRAEDADDVQEPLVIYSSETGSGDDGDALSNSDFKQPDQEMEENQETLGEALFGPMLGLCQASDSHQAKDLQNDVTTAAVTHTPTKNNLEHGRLLDSMMPAFPCQESPQDTAARLNLHSPSLFVTPEREWTSPAAGDVSSQRCSSDVVTTASEGFGNNETYGENPRKRIRLLQEENKAETILDCKFDQVLDRQMYLVRWTGYPAVKDTWELIEHLIKHVDLVVEYTRRKADAKASNIDRGLITTASSQPELTSAPADIQMQLATTNTQAAPANHVLLRIMDQKSGSSAWNKLPGVSTGTGEAANCSAQVPSPPRDERPQDNPLGLLGVNLSTKREESPGNTRLTAVKSTRSVSQTSNSIFSECRLIPISSPAAISPLADTKAPITTQSTNGERSVSLAPLVLETVAMAKRSDSPATAQAQKTKASAFPVVGPGWRKHGRTSNSRSYSPSPGPALPDPREHSPTRGDAKLDEGSNRSVVLGEAAHEARRISTARVLPTSSSCRSREDSGSGPFRHIKFGSKFKDPAPVRERTQSAERSLSGHPSFQGTLTSASSVTDSKKGSPLIAYKPKPFDQRRPEDLGANKLPEKPQESLSTIRQQSKNTALTDQKPQPAARKLCPEIKRPRFLARNTLRRDTQPSRASNRGPAPSSSADTRAPRGFDDPAATTSQAQRPSYQAMEQTGMKRKPRINDLLGTTSVPTRTYQ